MRLINTKTGKFEEFFNAKTIPHYAILSHTWVPEGEQTYQDVVKIQGKCGLFSPAASNITTDSSTSKDPSNVLSTTPVGTPQGDFLNARETYTLSQAALSTHQIGMETCALPCSSIPEQTGLLKVVEPTCPSCAPPSIWDPNSGLSEKILKACEIARLDGFHYIWVDSSCIDKTSSSELSEAINSMFNWYRDAQICYAFLSDVPSNEDVRAEDPDLHRLIQDFRRQWNVESALTRATGNRELGEHSAVLEYEKTVSRSKFCKSRWFRRAWTLQELIAPRMVVFLSKDWKGLGTKHSLADIIEGITHISRDILTHRKTFTDETVAKRMRWASEREATRVEDEAYSLLGIFGITMPALYGEGQNAFRRLQEEILQRIPDRSLFAWGVCRPIPLDPKYSVYASDIASPFAPSPKFFVDVGDNVSVLSKEDFRHLQVPVEEYTFTPHGIRTKLSFIPIKSLAPDLEINASKDAPIRHSWALFVLGSHQGRDGHRYLLGKLCTITETSPDVKLLHVPRSIRISKNVRGRPTLDSSIIFTFRISLKAATGIDTQDLVKPVTIYLPHPTPPIGYRQPEAGVSGDLHQPKIVFSLSPWAQGVLPRGYTISEWGSDLDPAEVHHLQRCTSSSLVLRLSNNSEEVDLLIQFRSIRAEPPAYSSSTWYKVVIDARVWTLSPNSTLDGSPPYNSVIWSTKRPDMTLPARDMHVRTQSRRSKTLRLWLGVATYGHYHIHVEVATNGVTANSTHPFSTRRMTPPDENAPKLYAMPIFHTKLKLTMLGSVRGALEAQGYGVHLERPDGNSDDSCSLSLTLSRINAAYSIVIKYFHILRTISNAGHTEIQELMVIARVTLESSSTSHPLHESEGYQDGPFLTTLESFSVEMGWIHRSDDLYLTLSTGALLRLTLGLDMAWVSEYYLVVNVIQQTEPYPTWKTSRDSIDRHVKHILTGTHNSTITLKLPGDVKRALKEHGYQVYFQGPNEYHSNCHLLTLSNANFELYIEYSHDLSEDSNGGQKLTFRARFTTLPPSHSSQGAATPPSVPSLFWDARYQRFGDEWPWSLLEQKPTLIFPNGLELTLRLGFYLLWLSEYCITVEVVTCKPSRKGWLTKFTDILAPEFIQHRHKYAGDQQERAGNEDAHSLRMLKHG